MLNFSQRNTVLYEMVIEHTISNVPLQSLLLVIEYFLCIFPFVISSIRKLFMINKYYSYNKLENNLRLFSRMKNSFIDNHNVLSSTYIISMLCISSIFTLSFLLFFFFYKKRRLPRIIEKIIVNFLNIFFFRYLSFIVVDSLVVTILSTIMDGQFYKSIMGIGFLLVLCAFLYCQFHVITNYAIYISLLINNLKSKFNIFQLEYYLLM